MMITPLSRCLQASALAALATASYSTQAVPIEVPNPSFEVDRGGFPDGLAEGEDVYMAPLVCDWYQYNINTNGGPQRYWNPSAVPVSIARFASSGFGGIAPDGDHVGIAITRYNDNKHPDGTTLPSANINPATGEPYPDTYVRDFEALAQVLEEVLFDPAEEYTLKVMVGHPPGKEGDPDKGLENYDYNGYAVQLLAGGYEFNEGNAYAPTIYGGTVIAEDNNTQVIAANTFVEITVTYTPPATITPELEALRDLPIQIRLCALEGPDHSIESIVAFDNVRLDGPPPPPILEIAPPAQGASHYGLQWNSTTGRQYDVLRSSDLTANDWTPLATGINATPPTNTFSVFPDGPTLFIRVDDKPGQ